MDSPYVPQQAVGHSSLRRNIAPTKDFSVETKRNNHKTYSRKPSFTVEWGEFHWLFPVCCFNSKVHLEKEWGGYKRKAYKETTKDIKRSRQNRNKNNTPKNKKCITMQKKKEEGNEIGVNMYYIIARNRRNKMRLT